MNVDYLICLHCGACAGSCPTNSIFLHETATIEFLPSCTECELCLLVCPVGAIAAFPRQPLPSDLTRSLRPGEGQL